MIEIYMKDGVVIYSNSPSHITRPNEKIKDKKSGKSIWEEGLDKFVKYSGNSNLYEKYVEMREEAQRQRERTMERAVPTPRFVSVRGDTRDTTIAPQFINTPYATSTSISGSPGSNSLAQGIGESLRVQQQVVDEAINQSLGQLRGDITRSSAITSAPF